MLECQWVLVAENIRRRAVLDYGLQDKGCHCSIYHIIIYSALCQAVHLILTFEPVLAELREVD